MSSIFATSRSLNFWGIT